MVDSTLPEGQSGAPKNKPVDVWKEWSTVLDDFKKAQAEQTERLESLFRLVQTASQQHIEKGSSTATSNPSRDNGPPPSSGTDDSPGSEKSGSYSGSDTSSKGEDFDSRVRVKSEGQNKGDIHAGLAKRRIERVKEDPMDILKRWQEPESHQPLTREVFSSWDGQEWSYLCFDDWGEYEPGRGRGKNDEDFVEFLPTYVPRWELVRDAKDGPYYHVDDVSRSHPFSVGLDQHERFDTAPVPYSFLPSNINLLIFAGVPICWFEMQDAVGNLFGAPPDGRMPLTFERGHLRDMKRLGLLEDFLKSFSMIESMAEKTKEISFAVFDVSPDLGGFREAPRIASYSSKLRPLDMISRRSIPPYAVGAFPSLTEEGRGLNIPPTAMDYGATFASFRCAFRPWNRLIVLRGASQLYELPSLAGIFNDTLEMRKLCGVEVDAHQLGGAFFKKATETIMDHFFAREPLSKSAGAIQQAINWHLRCYQHPQEYSMATSWRPIHFTWHAIMKPDQCAHPSYWPSGEYYLNRDLRIQRQSYTLVYAPATVWWKSESALPGEFERLELSRFTKLGCHYWTVLALTPYASDNTVSVSQREWIFDRPDDPSCLKNGQPAIMHLFAAGLHLASRSHMRLADTFDMEFGADQLVIDPEAHNRLLIDDDSFSRSKKYFWAVSFLEILIKQTQHILQETDAFFESREKVTKKMWLTAQCHRGGYPMLTKEQEWNHCVGELMVPIDQLRFTLQRFEAMHEKILNLRDGLFNASSVNESRASTRLAQNVKLLTYVSIFYLPLSFCVALWSTNENYSRPSLIVTTILVGIATYVIVANMHNVDALRRKIVYDFVGKKILRRMREASNDGKWEDKASGIKGFRVEERIGETSKWMVLKFWGVLGWSRIQGLFGKRGKNKVETADGEQGLPERATN